MNRTLLTGLFFNFQSSCSSQNHFIKSFSLCPCFLIIVFHRIIVCLWLNQVSELTSGNIFCEPPTMPTKPWNNLTRFQFCTFLCALQELDEFWVYRALLVELTKKLTYCVKAELIPLMEVTGVLEVSSFPVSQLK